MDKLLKEAIADAKAVRETAIANAKLALEEAFTPKLQSMLSAKLQEDDMEDEEEVEDVPVDDVAVEQEDELDAEAPAEDEEEVAVEQEDEEEVPAEDEEEVAVEGDEEGVEGEEEEDLELEAIIRELEDEGEEEEEVTEQEEEEEEEEVTEQAEEAPAEEEEDEEIDLDEVIKSLTEEDEEEEAPADDAEAELEEAYKTIKSLKSTLQEVNLLNAKLLFSNKLFKSNTLSENQKMKVIETFDRASNLREVKLVYSTLAESFNGSTVKKKTVTEGFASKKSNSTAPKGRIVESNDMASRMKRLAGLL